MLPSEPLITCTMEQTPQMTSPLFFAFLPLPSDIILLRYHGYTITAKLQEYSLNGICWADAPKPDRPSDVLFG